VLANHSQGIKRPGIEDEKYPPINGEFKNGEDILPLPPVPSWHTAWLINDRGSFTFFYHLTAYTKEPLK
jgi:hypothetical protein